MLFRSVPGCPPRPEQLIAAIIEMQEKIMQTGTFNGTEFAQRTAAKGPIPVEMDEVRRSREAKLVEGLEIYQPPKL